VSAQRWSDALVAAPVAATADGPVLLNDVAALDPRVHAEVDRAVRPGGTVWLLGGPLALAPAVGDALAADGFVVRRLAGSDRFATAAAAADEADGGGPILLADGTTFADALATSNAAARTHGVVLLTRGDVLPPASAAAIASRPGRAVVAVGGAAARARPGSEAVVGADRWATVVALADRFPGVAGLLGLASGESPADALAGAAQAAAEGAVLVLTAHHVLPPPVRDWLRRTGARAGWVYGGPSAIDDGVVAGVVAPPAG
jgi:hypothetical protein